MPEIFSATSPVGLPWLRAVPDSFRDDLRALSKVIGAKATGQISGDDLAALADHALSLDQLLALDRVLGKTTGRIGRAGDRRRTEPLKLAVLAEGSMDFITGAIRATGLRHGFHLNLYMPAFGQSTAELMAPDSGLARFAPEAALVAGTAQSLGLTGVTMAAGTAQDRVAAALAMTRTQVARLQAMGTGIIIVQTLPYGHTAWTGHLDGAVPGSLRAQIAAYNAGLVAWAGTAALIVLDANALAGLVGEASWSDIALWHRTKVPMALDVIPLYADHVLRLLRAARGRAAKCLVLDLDNTCWGGVIGDDGLDGIRIGQGSAEGEAFLAIQHYALSLRARGIVLAVCSKNDAATARLPFEAHPDMALRLDDIAVFIANWTDKASNIAAIARTLNIGTDALVFLDDNPAERARVRQSCPDVAVPEIGDDPALYPGLLAQGGYFETLALTADDALRADQYRANARRAAAVTEIEDYDTYLASLDMVCEIKPFDAVGRSRIAQLIGKSNQFNLTTRRYSEAEVAALEGDPDCLALQIRLTDRFGDNGMISVVIFRKAGVEWVCDTWLMSCRVLKRRVEEAVLRVVAQAAHAAGAERLSGVYIPSPRNGVVAGHFRDLGFVAAGTTAQGHPLWTLDLEGYTSPDLPLRLEASAVF